MLSAWQRMGCTCVDHKAVIPAHMLKIYDLRVVNRYNRVHTTSVEFGPSRTGTPFFTIQVQLLGCPSAQPFAWTDCMIIWTQTLIQTDNPSAQAEGFALHFRAASAGRNIHQTCKCRCCLLNAQTVCQPLSFSHTGVLVRPPSSILSACSSSGAARRCLP